MIAAPPRADPALLAESLFRHDHWTVAKQILRAIMEPHARVAVKASHASSKSFTAADAVLLTLVMGGDALTTAPTWAQVDKVLWGHVRAAVAHSILRAKDWGSVNQTEIRLPTGEFALGLSTNEGVRFQGHHARDGAFLLVVMDEAVGVRPDIWEAIEGIRAGGDVRMLVIGNPTVPSGPFFDIFSAQRSGWTTFTIDAFETPNLEGLTLEDLLAMSDEELDVSPRPYLVTRRWVKEKYFEWGEKSPLWTARVRGQFPDQSEDSLLSLAWLEAAQRREYMPGESDEWEAGIDVAGPGEDETVVTVRHGPHIEGMEHWASSDPRGEVLAYLAPYRERLKERSVKVDSIGQGYYFARHLEDNGWKGKIVDINVGESARESERYVNLKAELYWGLRLRAQTGDLSGLDDDLAISQLASIRYRHNARGQVVIESKDEALKRGVKSPDRAESIMLAFAAGPPAHRLVLY